MSEKGNQKYWMLTLFASIAIGGAIIQARGALAPTFKTTFVVSEGQLGLITPVATVGSMIAILAFGTASGRVDVKRVLTVSVAMMIVALVAIGLSPTFLLLLVFITLRSVSSGVFRSLDRPVLSHLYPESRARIFSLQTMAWAVGATAGPLAVTVILSWYSWPVTYFVLAAALVPVLIALWRLDRPPALDNEQSFEVGDVRSVLGDPGVYGMAIALIFVGGIESGFFAWLPYYANQMFPRNIANLTLSIYLAAYVPGRLAFSYLTERVRYTTLLVSVSVVLAVLLYGAFVLADGAVLLALIFAIGFLVSGLFPTLISLGIESRPSFTGPVNAIAKLSTQVGFVTVPAAIGFISQGSSIQQAMVLQIGLAVALATVITGLKLGPLATHGAAPDTA